MTVTVVIPAYNAARWIGSTLESVLSQPVPPASVVVIDDGSGDDGPAIVKGFGPRVTLVRQKNAGACRARNAGLERTASPHVMFLDADDYLEGDVLGGAARTFTTTGADLVICPVMRERPDGTRIRVFHYGAPPSAHEVFAGWLNHYSQPPCSILWRADFVRRIGGWDERVLKNQDGEIAMRAMLYVPTIAGFEDGHGVYREHGESSISRQRSSAALKSELQALHRLINAARKTVFGEHVHGFGRYLYVISRSCYQIGDEETARAALKLARDVGVTGHPGSWPHRVCAHVLGLQCKMILSNLVHSMMRNDKRDY